MSGENFTGPKLFGTRLHHQRQNISYQVLSRTITRYTRVHKTFRSGFQNHPHHHQGPVVIDLLAAGRHVKQRGGTGGSNMIDVQRTCHNSRLASSLLSLLLFSTNPCHDCIVIITQCYVSFNLSSLVVS